MSACLHVQENYSIITHCYPRNHKHKGRSNLTENRSRWVIPIAREHQVQMLKSATLRKASVALPPVKVTFFEMVTMEGYMVISSFNCPNDFGSYIPTTSSNTIFFLPRLGFEVAHQVRVDDDNNSN